MTTGPSVERIEIAGIGVAVETIPSRSAEMVTLAWVHGLGGASTRTFAAAARDPALADVRSLLIDLPGHGQSDRPGDWSYQVKDQAMVVISVLETVAPERVALFGHSMGGAVAIEVAQRAPGALRTLLVAEPNQDPGIGATSALIAAQREGDFVATGHHALVRAARLARHRSGSGSTWLETLAASDPVALHRSAVSLLADRNPTFRAQAEALRLPVAVIRGEHGDPGCASLASPTITHHLIPGAGHEMWVDNQPAFMAALITSLGI